MSILNEYRKMPGIWAETGYKPMTTFYGDFGVADHFGKGAIMDTFNRGLLYAKTDYKAFTEFVMVLNIKCWEHYEKGHNKESALYSDLYYKACDLFFEKFESNEEAVHYYYVTTD